MGQLFGNFLKSKRLSLGLSANSLAFACHVAQGTLSNIEHGRRPPSPANLEALAAMPELKTSLDELQAWADLDQIGGVEGFQRIQTHVPELRPRAPEQPLVADPDFETSIRAGTANLRAHGYVRVAALDDVLATRYQAIEQLAGVLQDRRGVLMEMVNQLMVLETDLTQEARTLGQITLKPPLV